MKILPHIPIPKPLGSLLRSNYYCEVLYPLSETVDKQRIFKWLCSIPMCYSSLINMKGPNISEGMPWRNTRSVALTCPIDSSIRIIVSTPGISRGILGDMPCVKGCKIFFGGLCVHHRGDRDAICGYLFSLSYQLSYLLICIYCKELAFAMVGVRLASLESVVQAIRKVKLETLGQEWNFFRETSRPFSWLDKALPYYPGNFFFYIKLTDCRCYNI